MKRQPFTAVGVDVGGTKIAAGLVTFPAGNVYERRIIPTLPDRPGEAVLADVEHLVHELRSLSKIDAIGLGICEIVNRVGEIASANCIRWQNLTVRHCLSEIAPTTIEADVRAAALAEHLYGAARGAETFLYISIGTGISACVFAEGRPFKGARGAPGTIASGSLPRFNETNSAGASLTLEQIAAGPGIVARFKALGGNACSGQEVLGAAAADDPRAMRVVRSGAETLGATIGWLVNTLDPELVVLGGGLGLSEGLYRDVLLESARRHIWWDGHRDLPIVPAKTGTDAGVIGAAAAAWRA